MVGLATVVHLSEKAQATLMVAALANRGITTAPKVHRESGRPYSSATIVEWDAELKPPGHPFLTLELRNWDGEHATYRPWGKGWRRFNDE